MHDKKVEVIKLKFINGVHIGRGAEELDKTAITYGSDALKSALFTVGLPFYPEWSTKPEEFFGNFTISSVFPWCDDELFLPKTANIRFHFENGNDLTEAKLAKKIAYISFDVLKKWSDNPGIPIVVQENQIVDDAFLFSGASRKFLRTEIQQRVQVPRESDGEARPFYFERLLFAEHSGLYFLLSTQNDKRRLQILHALQILGNLGIGTDRTVGNGQFEIASIGEYNLLKGNSGLQMALGLYLPSEEEIENIDLDQSFWSLAKRGGYIAGSDKEVIRSLRKNNIYFFGEASVFKSDSLLKGRLVDLQPSDVHVKMHPVWRCGMPLFIDL